GLLVNPPEGLEIGYVPIVTRQEKDSSITAVGVLNDKKQVIVYPNPTPSYIQIECTQQDITEIKLTDGQGKLIKSWPNVIQKRFQLNLENYENGLYIVQIHYGNGNTSTHQIIKQ
ncbi:MAG: T9SS type A sorting domain-containing protein, partial [Flavobacteriales bacterium]|nr:T9SS type A sorting domain-containing protein [Flavobacteriales bacterium]